MHRLFYFLIAGLSIHISNAQADSTSTSHYFSLQGNQLIRQVFNFAGSSSDINNPYLINYSFNKGNGWGMNFGTGFEINNFQDDDDFETRETNIRSLFFRIGFDKKTFFTEKLMFQWGADFLIQNVVNNTENKFPQGNGTTQIVTTDISDNGWGIGPRIGVSYFLAKNILIGTESTYYFNSITRKSKVDRKYGGVERDEKSTNNYLKLHLPAVLYFTIKI